MRRTPQNTNSRIFLISSHLSELELRRLIAGEGALAARDEGMLQLAAAGSTPLAGVYRALLTKRQGNLTECNLLLEDLISGPERNRAIVALGANYFDLGDYGAAELSFNRSEPGTSPADAFCAVYSARMRAILLGIRGHHREALAELESGLSLARSLAPVPLLFLDYLNSIAVELTEDGQYDAARRVINPLLCLPQAGRRPEWTETASDERLLRPVSRSILLNINDKNDEPEPSGAPDPLPPPIVSEEATESRRVLPFPTPLDICREHLRLRDELRLEVIDRAASCDDIGRLRIAKSAFTSPRPSVQRFVAKLEQVEQMEKESPKERAISEGEEP